MWHHCLGFDDERGPLFLNHLVEVFHDFFVTGGCFGNNEVQENDTSNCYDQGPNNPVDSIELWLQVVRTIEIIVTHRHPERLENVSYEESDLFVLLAEVAIIVWLIVFGEGFSQFEISNAENVNQKREQHGDDGIESQEDPQIINDAPNHSDNVTQIFKDSKEEEGLHEKHENNQDHVCSSRNGEGTHDELLANVDDSGQDADEVTVVPRIVEIVSSFSDQL
jgi:hypothetical protein